MGEKYAVRNIMEIFLPSRKPYLLERNTGKRQNK